MSVAPRCVRGRDGKVYPAWPLTADEREFLVGRVHYLSHRERLSVRSIIRRLDQDHRVRRSLGTVHSWLHGWTCDGCSGVTDDAPEHPQLCEEAA